MSGSSEETTGKHVLYLVQVLARPDGFSVHSIIVLYTLYKSVAQLYQDEHALNDDANRVTSASSLLAVIRQLVDVCRRGFENVFLKSQQLKSESRQISNN